MPPADPPPVLDRDHLDRQTMGDAALADELAAMLLAQLDAVERDMRGVDASEQARLAHRLAGASANLGAFRLAEAARAVANGEGGERALDRLLAEARELAAILRG